VKQHETWTIIADQRQLYKESGSFEINRFGQPAFLTFFVARNAQSRRTASMRSEETMAAVNSLYDRLIRDSVHHFW